MIACLMSLFMKEYWQRGSSGLEASQSGSQVFLQQENQHWRNCLEIDLTTSLKDIRKCSTVMKSGRGYPKTLAFQRKIERSMQEEFRMLQRYSPETGPLLVALISPYRRSREMARELIGADRFVEVYVKASVETCKKRDPKGLYAKAERGEITNLTGLQEPYEEPTNPDIILDTEKFGPDECIEKLVMYLYEKGLLNRKN